MRLQVEGPGGFRGAASSAPAWSPTASAAQSLPSVTAQPVATLRLALKRACCCGRQATLGRAPGSCCCCLLHRVLQGQGHRGAGEVGSLFKDHPDL